MDYEKLGAFYLGRRHDLQAGETSDEPILYDAKDLTTHAVCVGMTGSGKTGLCIGLLEEAAIDGVPAIAIDPKGDLGNLMLTFPKLSKGEFEPWVDPGTARRKGQTVPEFAASQAALWKKGLAAWDQGPERIKRFRDAVDIAIYTPGSNAGLPLTVLRSFDAPDPIVRADSDAMRERVMTAASGLLTLVGIDADPSRSREHILLSAILDHAWRAGRSLDLGGLINAVQAPPFERLGVMDLDSFFPSKDRFGLAMALNGLLASPGFSAWLEGEPLNIDRLLYTAEGKPRLSIISIAHLSESERMFFVTLLLNEMVSWMRKQSGTSSLRALLYMDEVFGYFPPVANPPSKTPMLTLLKQARAYGLGVVLATQNPVDLDYKGLSNTGTWFLGRLQTERDKMRVLEGLEGASASSGASFDRQAMEETLAGLGSRVFLMHNVHDDAPEVFHTRWVLSYLRGPLTRVQVETLMADRKAAAPVSNAVSAPTRAEAHAAPAPAPEPAALASGPPPAPSGVTCGYLPLMSKVGNGTLMYRPALLGRASLHYAQASADVDEWRDVGLFVPLDGNPGSNPWEDAEQLEGDIPELESDAEDGAAFADLPNAATRAKQYDAWAKRLVSHLYREEPLEIFRCAALKRYSRPDQDEAAFRADLRNNLRDQRDLAVEKLRKKYSPKLAKLQDRIRKAEIRVEKEESQYKSARMQTAVSFGGTVLGALFGRKVKSVGTVSRAGSAVKSVGRAAQQRGDIGHAKENVEALQEEFDTLQQEFEEELEGAREVPDPADLELTKKVLRAKKADMGDKQVMLVWAPYKVDGGGIATPLF